MGHFANFFAANDAELQVGFPYRHSVEKEIRESESVNPFTRESVKTRVWQPTAIVPPPPSNLEFPNEAEQEAFKKLEHAELKNIDPVTLSTLQEILGVNHYADALSELFRLQFVTPGADDQMYELPPAFVVALANISDLEAIAPRWLETDELREWWSFNDAKGVLEVLRTLARHATASNRRVICWLHGF
jgi:hypothetical protein